MQDVSPQQHLPDPSRYVHVFVADRDTADFKRQSLDYTKACRRQRNPVALLEVAGRNHFDIILDWMRPDTALTRSVLALAHSGS